MTDASLDFPREQIAKRAFQIWDDQGRPDGQDLANWLQAEQELQACAAPARKARPRKVHP